MDYSAYVGRCDLLRMMFVVKVTSALSVTTTNDMKVDWIEKDLLHLNAELESLKTEYLKTCENIDPFSDESKKS
jgi:hypothetical protein